MNRAAFRGLLALCLAVLLICDRSAVAQTTRYTVGVLAAYPDVAALALQALYDLNNGTYGILPTVTLVPILVGDTVLGFGTVRNVLEIIDVCNDNGVNPIAAVGGSTSLVSEQIQPLFSAYYIPQISAQATSPRLSDKTSFPFFLRTVPPSGQEAAATIAFVSSQKWSRIAEVHTSDSYGTYSLAALLAYASAARIHVSVTEAIPLNSVTNSSFSAQINELKSFSGRVVVLQALAPVAAPFLREAAAAGILSPEWVWIISESLYYAVAIRDPAYDDLFPYLVGKFFTSPSPGAGPVYDRLVSIWEQHNRSLLELNIYSLASYDAMLAVGYGTEAVLSARREPTDGNVLLTYLKRVSFLGTSGRLVRFDEDGNPLGTEFTIWNLHPGPTNVSFVLVAITNFYSNGTLTLNESLIYWGTPNNKSPVNQQKSELPAWAWSLVGLGILVAVLVIAGIALALIQYKWHILFIPKGEDNDEWGGDDEMEDVPPSHQESRRTEPNDAEESAESENTERHAEPEAQSQVGV